MKHVSPIIKLFTNINLCLVAFESLMLGAWSRFCSKIVFLFLIDQLKSPPPPPSPVNFFVAINHTKQNTHDYGNQKCTEYEAGK